MSRKPKDPHAPPPQKKTPEERAAEKRERFVRLAEKRTVRALKALENVGRLGNRASYTYSLAEACRIVDALTGCLQDARRMFEEEPASSAPPTILD